MSSTQYIDIERTLKTLDDDLHPENAAALRSFITDCAAEGLSEVRQVRLVTAWKTLLSRFAPADLRMADATEAQLKQLVVGLNRSDYAASTVHTVEAVVERVSTFGSRSRGNPFYPS